MPTITKIARQTKHKDLFNIFVDGKFFCGLDGTQLGLLNLKINQPISHQQLAKLKETASQSKAYHKALRYLGFRPRSVFEMRQYLIKNSFDQKIIDHTIKLLTNQNLLNDQNFCRSWINSRDLIKPTSSRQLFLELIAKGVDKEIIQQALSDRYPKEIENIKLIIQKKQARYSDKQKLIQFLLRRGFKYSDIKLALDDLSASCH